MGDMGLGSVGRGPPIAFPCRIPYRGLCFLYVRFMSRVSFFYGFP
jgi:hypothetical protein